MFLTAILLLLGFGSLTQAEDLGETHEFTTDVSKMMKILINSLYSNKDIFLRELISNAADALNKVRFQSLTDKEILGEGEHAKLDIRIIPDQDEKTLTIIDRGIGMNKTELITNLGTLAHSGTQRFLEGVENGTSAVDLIGQFGVGFYSAFLVADKVTVTSKRKGGKQHIWVSDNAKSFEVTEDTSGVDLFRGTKITLKLNDKKYADPKRIKELALHYSEFVDFPIYVRMERDLNDPEQKRRAEEEEARMEDEDEDEDDDYKPRGEISYTTEDGRIFDFIHVNPHKAIWLRDPKTVKRHEYVDFFRSLTRDYTSEPLTWQHFSAEGDVGFRSILYIPAEPPRDSSAVKLYVHRVLISEEFDNFLPRYLSFIRGIVDSDELDLNVSREMLQESRTMRQISKKLVRKIIQMISDLAEKEDKDGDLTYQDFYRYYNRYIKMGVLEDIPNQRRLARLLRFNTTKSEKTPISLDTYMARMRKGQSDFFYIAGDPATSNIQQSPFLIPYKKRGIEVLFLSDPVDEMVIQHMREYDHKMFICVTQVEKKSLTTESEFERQKLKQWKKRMKPLVHFLKETLAEKVERVEVSTRLAVDSRTPCVLAHVEGSASANMERYSRKQNSVDPRYGIYASRKVMEINPMNSLIKRMNTAVQQIESDGIDDFDEFDEEGEELTDDQQIDKDRAKQSDKEKLETMALLLYDTAVFESGYIIGDSNEYAERVFNVLTTMTGLPNAPVKESSSEDSTSDDEDEEEEEELVIPDDPDIVEDEEKELEAEEHAKEEKRKKKEHHTEQGKDNKGKEEDIKEDL